MTFAGPLLPEYIVRQGEVIVCKIDRFRKMRQVRPACAGWQVSGCMTEVGSSFFAVDNSSG